MLLHQGSGYMIEEGYVEIIGGVKFMIIGWDRRYDDYENREARLVYRGDRMILWISKKMPKLKPYQPRDVIAVDANERKMVYGDHVINKERDTGLIEPIDVNSMPKASRRDTPLRDTLHGGGERGF